ncbi:MAG: DUF1822 family protein [Crinalium sp.]
METLTRLDELATAYPNHLWLEFSKEDKAVAWEKAQAQSYPAGRWNAYLNSLSSEVLMTWLRTEPDIAEEPTVWPDAAALPSIWEVVNGTAITLGHSLLVILPTETDDIQELRVSQEWVDIPGWEADYYLAVQIDLEENWLRVWGYTTHQQLKATGSYDAVALSYFLERENLIEDLNVMLVAREFCTSEKVEVAPLPKLSAAQAEVLLTLLGQPSSYSPRILVPFEQWGVFLANDEWRQNLYQQRLANTQREAQTTPSVTPNKSPVNLGQWLQQNFSETIQAGWQAWEGIFGTPEPSLALAGITYRSEQLRHSVTELIESLYTSLDEHQRRQAAAQIVAIRLNDSETAQAINALLHVLRTTKDEETRWKAAESLLILDPSNSEGLVHRVKSVDLGIQMAGYQVALAIKLLPRSDGLVSAFVQVHPMKKQTILPENLNLSVLDEIGDTFEEATARSNDNSIQCKFWGRPGERFSIRVSLGDAGITENFMF